MASNEVLIFVVDDEPTIIENLQHALEDAGYVVSSASNGADAMIFVETKAHDFRGLVTDINLPGNITGWGIAHRARELNPTLPVVYMTGGAGHEWSANGVPESVLLTKPVALVQVVTAVAQLMNTAPVRCRLSVVHQINAGAPDVQGSSDRMERGGGEG